MIYPSWYGSWIAFGIFLVITLLRRDRLFVQKMTYDQTIDLAFYVLVAGIVGGRLLFVIDCWHDFSWRFLWDLTIPGFSVLGSVIAAAGTLFWYLKKHEFNVYEIADRIALYAPLLHMSGRIGCFCVGCCYGTACSYPWAVVYEKASSLAPLGVAIHPTQLYSAFFFLLLFLMLYCIDKVCRENVIPGLLVSVYLISLGIERFVIDFLRDDRILVSWTRNALSSSQVCALLLSFYAFVHVIYIFEKRNDG